MQVETERGMSGQKSMNEWGAKAPEGTKIKIRYLSGVITSIHRVLPDGTRIEMPVENPDILSDLMGPDTGP